MRFILPLLLILAFANVQASPVNSTNLSGYQGIVIPSVSVTIANGQTASSVISLNGFSLASCQMPAAFTGTALTFSSSQDGVTYTPVYNSSGAVSYTVAASRTILFSANDTAGIHYLKLVSGSSEGAARTLICALKGN